jgi:hypothetical protein
LCRFEWVMNRLPCLLPFPRISGLQSEINNCPGRFSSGAIQFCC